MLLKSVGVLLNLKAPQQEKIKFFVHKVEKSKSEQSEENHEEVAENKKIDIKELDKKEDGDLNKNSISNKDDTSDLLIKTVE